MNRRKFLYTLAVGTGVGVGSVVYSRYVESYWLSVERVKIPLRPKHGGRPIILLQLADFHVSSYVPLEFVEEAVVLGLKSRPDLVCLTGDFVTGILKDESAYARILRRLSDAAPTFASLGNHDGGAWSGGRFGYEDTTAVEQLLADSGVTCLLNASARVSIAGRQAELIGLGDLWAGNMNVGDAFAKVSSGDETVRVVMSHNPDTKTDLASHAWDLMLCGHTHGGQIRIPFVGSPFLPISDRRFAMGLHRWQNHWIYVTKGVGNLHGVRFNCRPEVTVLEVG